VVNMLSNGALGARFLLLAYEVSYVCIRFQRILLRVFGKRSGANVLASTSSAPLQTNLKRYSKPHLLKINLR